MKNLNEEINKFRKLVIYKHADIKPIISEEIETNLGITPEELIKFKETLIPIKTIACQKSKRRCKKCVEMVSNLENGKVSNRLIENCFDCKFGESNYENCESLKGKFKSILSDIQKEKGIQTKDKNSIIQNAGQVLGFASTLRMLVQDVTNLFKKDGR